MKTYVGGAVRQPWLIAIALTLATGTALSAHDFWIEVSDFEAATGRPLRVQLRVGEEFAGEPVRRDDARIEKFVAKGPDGERQVIGRDGAAPAGIVRLDTPGVWTIGYQSRPSALTLEAEAFERYLREEGLEHVLRERVHRRERHKHGRERFGRSVKTLVRAGGDPGTWGFDRQLGLPLEFVAETSPFAERADSASLRLLYLGRPLKGALVFVLRKGDLSATKGDVMTRARTDANGRIRVPLGPGVWMIKAVHMVRVNAADADWESVWTSLTYEVRPGGRQRG